MEITTDFNVGDTIYYTHNNEIVEAKVSMIYITVGSNHNTDNYTSKNGNKYFLSYDTDRRGVSNVDGHNAFASPEALTAEMVRRYEEFNRKQKEK